MAAIVPKDVASRWSGIIPGRETSANEEIETTIAIEISRANRRRARQHRWERMIVLRELSTTLVDVEAILQELGCRSTLIPAARNVQVGQSVAIRVEEKRAPIFISFVGNPRLICIRRNKASVFFLNEELARRSRSTTDEHIIEAIAVDVTHRESRTLS